MHVALVARRNIREEYTAKDKKKRRRLETEKKERNLGGVNIPVSGGGGGDLFSSLNLSAPLSVTRLPTN